MWRFQVKREYSVAVASGDGSSCFYRGLGSYSLSLITVALAGLEQTQESQVVLETHIGGCEPNNGHAFLKSLSS